MKEKKYKTIVRIVSVSGHVEKIDLGKLSYENFMERLEKYRNCTIQFHYPNETIKPLHFVIIDMVKVGKWDLNLKHLIQIEGQIKDRFQSLSMRYYEMSH